MRRAQLSDKAIIGAPIYESITHYNYNHYEVIYHLECRATSGTPLYSVMKSTRGMKLS